MTTPLQTYLSEIRARVEKATEGPWRISMSGFSVKSNADNPIVCKNPKGVNAKTIDIKDWLTDADFIAASRTDIPRLLRIVERAVEALKNAELSFMGMGNATIDHGLPPTAQELINMCEDRAKRMQAFLAEIDAMARGEE